MPTRLPRLLAALLMLIALTTDVAAGGLTWETRQIQRTATLGDKEVVAEFAFKNTGTAPVTIRDIHTSCECTVAELAKRTYAPGESGTIRTVFTLGDRMGLQERVITLVTDDPEDPAPALTLRVEIPDLLTYSARMLHWQVGAPAEEKSIEIGANGKSRLAGVTIKEIKPNQATARIEATEDGAKYRVHIKPAVLDAPITVGLTFVATFADGAQRSFFIYALVR